MQSTENLIGTKYNVETAALSAGFHCSNKGTAEEGSRGDGHLGMMAFV